MLTRLITWLRRFIPKRRHWYNETCGTCRCYLMDEYDVMGVCRAHPPSIKDGLKCYYPNLPLDDRNEACAEWRL